MGVGTPNGAIRRAGRRVRLERRRTRVCETRGRSGPQPNPERRRGEPCTMGSDRCAGDRHPLPDERHIHHACEPDMARRTHRVPRPDPTTPTTTTSHAGTWVHDHHQTLVSAGGCKDRDPCNVQQNGTILSTIDTGTTPGWDRYIRVWRDAMYPHMGGCPRRTRCEKENTEGTATRGC